MTIWVRNPRLFAAAEQMARDVERRYPRTPVLFVVPPGTAVPDGWQGYSAPRHRTVIRWMLHRLRAQTLVVVGAKGLENQPIVSVAHARGASLILLKEAGAPAATGEQLFDLAIDADTALAGESGLHEKIDALITRSRKRTMAARGRLSLGVRVLRVMSRWFAPLLALKFHEYRTIEALRTELRAPESILCLGNGPSSEDPAIRRCDHQRLFRVNMSWQTRGTLTAPDLVFTGLASAIDAVKPVVGFVFGTAQSAENILARHLSSRRRVRYACCERLGFMDMTAGVGSAPTNGALMVAIAAAMRPQRLIVAGIDLYAHPGGAYPDDPHTPNAYAAGHDARTEIDYMVGALRSFDGELLICGSALREALAAAGVKSVPVS